MKWIRCIYSIANFVQTQTVTLGLGWSVWCISRTKCQRHILHICVKTSETTCWKTIKFYFWLFPTRQQSMEPILHYMYHLTNYSVRYYKGTVVQWTWIFFLENGLVLVTLSFWLLPDLILQQTFRLSSKK